MVKARVAIPCGSVGLGQKCQNLTNILMNAKAPSSSFRSHEANPATAKLDIRLPRKFAANRWHSMGGIR
jgi:hypothetical protein